jgi:hypothetical protein
MRNQCMEYGEQWILETAVTFRLPLSCLISPHIEELFNKPGHGLERAKLAEVMARLLLNRDIVLEPQPRISVPQQASLMLKAFLERDDNVLKPLGMYGLTLQGGERWAKAAEANWAHFITGSCRPKKLRNGDLVLAEKVLAASVNLANRYIELYSKTGRTIFRKPNSVRSLSPMRATYWKTLSKGYKVTFSSKDSDQERDVEAIMRTNRRIQHLTRWYRRARQDQRTSI